MQFTVIAHDYKDEKALERRLAIREEHLRFANKMFDEKKWLFASALLDENGNMNGSIIFCEYESEEKLKSEWLNYEVYVTGKVWETITVRKVKVALHNKQ